MAKPEKPLLSFGAKGTIGDTLTFQKRGRLTIARTKPTPAYRYTLSQAYQRWLYEDYAYLWTQQDAAIRREYSAAGSRFHLTGFQYWMKYHLTNLPDIAAMWHLDEKAGAVAYDSSRNANHGALIGASPSELAIDGAYSFDGLNDHIKLPLTPSLANFTKRTVLFFFKAGAFTGTSRYIYDSGCFNPPFGGLFYLDKTANTIVITLRPIIGPSVSVFIPFTPDKLHFLAYSWDGTQVRFYIDNTLFDTKPLTGILAFTPFQNTIGCHHLFFWWYDGLLDNFAIYRRALDPTEIARYSERRYPA